MPVEKERPLLVPVGFALAALLAGLVLYRFANFREEAAVKRFLEEIKSGNSQHAYELWGPSPAYSYQDFVSDWGEQGYYGKVKSYRILDSKTRGSGVVVYVQINDLKKPLAFWVERKNRTLGFSPIYEYQDKQ